MHLCMLPTSIHHILLSSKPFAALEDSGYCDTAKTRLVRVHMPSLAWVLSYAEPTSSANFVSTI